MGWVANADVDATWRHIQSVQSRPLTGWVANGDMDAYVVARSIRAISAVDGVEVGTYRFVRDGSQMVAWMPTWRHIRSV